MKGIDIQIESLRKTFEDHLWLDFFNSFNGRCMRNYRDKMIPEVLNPGSLNYNEVLLDDTKTSISFFDVLPERTEQKATVHIYFAVNLSKLYPSVSERATEYALSDAILLIRTHGLFTIEGITDGYESWSNWDKVKREDNMHPFYLFRIETTVEYKLTC